MADRNEVLANFQALSNIEDIAICLDILEQKGWDLMAAVNSVLPDNNTYQPPPPVQEPLQADGVVDLTGNGSVSHSQVVDLTRDPLHTRHTITNSLTHPPPHRVSDGHTHTGAGPNHPTNHTGPLPYGPPQSGPLRSRPPQSGPLPLRSGPLQYGPSQSRPLISGPLQSGPLRSGPLVSGPLHYGPPQSGPPRFSPTDPPPAVGGARSDGEECAELLEATLSTNQDHTQQAPDPPISTVSSSPASSAYGDACDQSNNTDEDDEEEEEEEEEDMDAGLDSLSLDAAEFTSETPYQRAMKEPLIPEDCVEVTEALHYFTTRFELRYGAMHPLFYVGGLREAVREATSGLGHHKPMLIYLHHDASILSNVFCSQLLCSESVVSYLTNNYTTWAWDLTSTTHRTLLLSMIADCFGPMARARVNDIHSDSLPVILIVSKVHGNVDVRNIIQGETNLDGLMTSLITAMEEHNIQIETERKEERERLAREHMIAEQNAAYEKSLEVDREKRKRKEQQKLQEEEERQEREAVRQSMESVLPEEPPADCTEKLATLRVRLPNGSTVQRRFLASHTLQDLFNYIGSMDYSVADHKLLRSYTRTDLSSLQPGFTLEKVDLCPQDTLFLEER